MPEYQWALGNGEIVTADYNRANDSLSGEKVKTELISAFNQFGNSVNCEIISEQLSEVYKITSNNSEFDEITICAKGTTPGGRSNLNDEQRTQQKSKYINYAFKKIQNGQTALQLGIYCREGQTVFCAWKLKQSSADDDTPISKQIKITTIAQAMKEGFAQQEKGSGEYVCAFRKEFIYFYVRNSNWLHSTLLSKSEERSISLPNEKSIDNKSAFKAWMGRQVKANGKPYSENTINIYISQMERGYALFDKFKDYDSVFQIQTAADLDKYTAYLFNEEGFDEFNDRAGNQSCSCGLAKYKEFILENAKTTDLVFKTGLESRFSRNRILFGAPGTGKSFKLNNDRMSLLGPNNEEDYERVTFHPDYSYANFVGTYKPVPRGEAITYEYVPGPFMRIYVNALKNGRTDDIRPFLLIVEEINRANVTAVFGDIFQLLDRGNDEVSEYPIQASEDIKKYLAKELGGFPENYTKIRIPDNMFIWSTMNSADQGVFPMDTAFKRRWEFTYIGINANEAGIAGKYVTIGTGNYTRTIEWNVLRKAINERLSTFKINEDKLLGPYFLSRKVIPTDGEIIAEFFKNAFKNKVLMYLFDDAAKQKRSSLFAAGVDTTKYSAVCDAFDEMGVFVFCTEISSKFPMTIVGESE